MRQVFEVLQFKCSDCSQTYAFNTHRSHKVRCLIKSIPCILGCNNGTLYKGIQEHLDHAQSDCPKVSVLCIKCNGQAVKDTFSDHDCVPVLINAVNANDKDSLKAALTEIKA